MSRDGVRGGAQGKTRCMSMRVVEWFPPLFRDRVQAGRALADAVAAAPPEQPLVVALARGGVAVAVEVARRLRAPVTAVGVARVNAHGLRLGATTGAGPPYLVAGHGVPEEAVAPVVERARRDAGAVDRRLALGLPSVGGRTVLVVDDGAVTGLTLAAGCRWALGAGAARVVAAVPVAAPRGVARVAEVAEAVICPHVLDALEIVGQAYEDFEALDEWFVAGLLEDAR